LGSPRDGNRPERPPATTRKGREDQLITLAYDVAEEQLRSGKASSQVITQFLKAGSTRDEIEKKRLEKQIEEMQAKIDNMVSAEHIEHLYEKAIEAMRRYQGRAEDEIIIED
jgi:hypothetical protein